MEEKSASDEVVPVPIKNYDQPTDTARSDYCVAPDLENLLNVFVKQSKDGEGDSASPAETAEESITLYADKMEISVTELDKMEISVTELLTQKPSVPPVPEHIVKMMLPLDFGTETPGDDLLATIFQESVNNSSNRISSPTYSKTGSHVVVQTDGQICSQTDGQNVSNSDGQIGSQSNGQICSQTDGQIVSQSYGQIGSQSDGQIGSLSDGQIGNQIGSQNVSHSDGQPGSQTDRQENSPVNSWAMSEPVNPPPGEAGQEVRGQSEWVRSEYPEIYREWSAVSGDPVSQGKVRMFCSKCRDNPSQGFLAGFPVCEKCRLGQACSVCKIRVTSTFSYGLALCEADRLFLYRMFSQQPQLSRCQSLCPVKVQRWCGYCRFRSCLTTRGFRFFLQVSTNHLMDKPRAPERKRKYSGQGVYKELNFVGDAVPADNINIPPVKKNKAQTSPRSQSVEADSVFVKPSVPISSGSVQLTSPSPSPTSSKSAAVRASPSHSYFNSAVVKPSASSIKSVGSRPSYYDGSALGLTNQKKSPGLLNDPERVAWVLQQQEKFLKHHMELFRRRNGGRS